jgi:hypothetical protein
MAISKDCGKRGKRLHVFLAFHQASFPPPQFFARDFLVGHLSDEAVYGQVGLRIFTCYKSRMKLLNQLVVSAVIAGLIFFVSGCHSHIPHASADEVARVTSPNGLVDAVLTESNGGATTSFD